MNGELFSFTTPPRQDVYWARRGLCCCCFVAFPYVLQQSNNIITLCSEPRVISKILFRGVMIPALVKAVTLTYSLTEILIIIISIYVISVVSDKGTKRE